MKDLDELKRLCEAGHATYEAANKAWDALPDLIAEIDRLELAYTYAVLNAAPREKRIEHLEAECGRLQQFHGHVEAGTYFDFIKQQQARIERLEAALRELAKEPEPRYCYCDEIARAALEPEHG